MNITLKFKDPTHKRRLSTGIHWWAVVAGIGLLGTLTSGTTAHFEGNLTEHHFSIYLSPLAIITSLVWAVGVYMALRQNSRLTRKYSDAINGKEEFINLTDDGVEWGYKSVTQTKLIWNAISYYSIDKTELRLGLPGSAIAVQLEELDGMQVEEFQEFMKKVNVKKID
ncbi:MAG: hypothetical protein COA78_29945 [Blastopirellula sp.]|nr:MAG: hypothetical protein COA78_29945 [Blastopirellula sp.]